MSLFSYTVLLKVPKRDCKLSAEEILERLRHTLSLNRVKSLRQSANTLVFRNLYLKKVDLLPVPSGWIRVQDGHSDLTIAYSADYGWRTNRPGRWLVGCLASGMVLTALIHALAYLRANQAWPPIEPYLVIPILILFFWCFVYGTNCLYSRLFLKRIIRFVLPMGKAQAQSPG